MGRPKYFSYLGVTIVASYLLDPSLKVGESMSYSCYPNSTRTLVGIKPSLICDISQRYIIGSKMF